MIVYCNIFQLITVAIFVAVTGCCTCSVTCSCKKPVYIDNTSAFYFPKSEILPLNTLEATLNLKIESFHWF